jgi:hypothetical protein
MRTSARSKIAAAVLAGAVVAGVVALVVRGGDDDATTASSAPRSRLEQAVDLAAIEFDGVDDDDVEEMIEELCTTQEGEALAALVVGVGVTAEPDVLAVVEGIGRGASGYCPEVAGAKPQLVNDAYNAALDLLDDKG